LPVVDDPAISDDEILLRRIPYPEEITPDVKADLGFRPRSSAFDRNRDGSPMSVQRLLILQERGLDPATVMLAEFPTWGIVSFRARLIRQFGKGVAPDVTVEDGPAHAIIEELTSSQQRQIARTCEWLVVPRGPPSGAGPTR
jgi:hypothetical protein